MKKIILAILILIFSYCQYTNSQEGILLVNNGNSDFRIVPSADASPIEVFAGQELQGYITQSSGGFLPMSNPNEPILGRRIYLGRRAVERLGLTLDDAKLHSDGFIIKTIGDRIAIAGCTPRGTLYGVYAFLEGIGCRWLAPGVNGEVIPIKHNIIIPNLDIMQIPKIQYRGFKSSFVKTFTNTDWIDWVGKNRLNLIIVESDMFSDLQRIAGGEMERRGIIAGVSLAVSNSEESKKKIMDFIKANPQAEIIELYPEKNDKNIDQIATIANNIALNYPEKKIFLRVSHNSIPNNKNSINYEFFFTPIDRCYRHHIGDRACEINTKQRLSIQKLIRTGRQIGLSEYYMGSYDQNSIPFPILQTIFSDIKYVSAFDNVNLYITQCELGNWGTYGINYYTFARMAWNSKYELGWIIDDYCDKFFGQASNHLKKYFSLLEDAMAKVDHISYIDPPELIVRLLDETTLKKLQDCLDNAKTQTDDVITYERIRKIQLSLDYTVLLWNTISSYLSGVEYQETGNKKMAKINIEKSIESGEDLIKFLYKNVDEDVFIVTQSFIFDYIDVIVNDARNRLDTL
ncbi:MAG: DUF4838 domain-containing protein [Candidatus Poribacteria bacterium]